MWPFGRKRAARLRAVAAKGGEAASPGDAGAPVAVEVTVASGNDQTSPLTGLRAALFHFEILERIPQLADDGFGGSDQVADHYARVATMILGDALLLRDDDGDVVTVMARRARIGFAMPHHGGTPLTRIPPEIVPLLRNATGRGILCFREHAVREGDRFRFTGRVEAVNAVVERGYRSEAGLRFVARDDVEPALLEEIFEVPDF